MIRVDRGLEPVALRNKRYVNLARARIDVAAGRKPKTEGYNSGRNTLWDAGDQKCCYCE